MKTVPVMPGWLELDPPTLIAQRCNNCDSTFFPPIRRDCGNPVCDSGDLAVVGLSRIGRVWSYTDAQYQPPSPYIPDGEEHVPFALAAVELSEGLVVMGQVARGYGVDDLDVGAEVELTVERLYSDADAERMTWRWKPVRPPGAANEGAEG